MKARCKILFSPQMYSSFTQLRYGKKYKNIITIIMIIVMDIKKSVKKFHFMSEM